MTVTALKSPPPAYRPDIDGLRAIAILSVIAYHAFPNWIRGGFIGVDVFFVLSGFLISSQIMQGLQAGTFSLRIFYAKRVKRIFPSLALVLLFCLMSGWIILTPAEYEQLGKHAVGGIWFVDNFIFWREAGYFDSAAHTKPLLHLWSLSIEEQFYLLWPLILGGVWKFKKPLGLLLGILFLASFTSNVWMAQQDIVADFYSPWTGCWELLLGAGIAYAHLKNLAIPQKFQSICTGAGLLSIGFAVGMINATDRFPGALALLPTLGTALVIFAGKSNWLNRTILSSAPLVWIGLISYPLYLWHWPLLSFAHILASDTPSVTARILLLLTSVLLAWLTFRFVEYPFRFGRFSRHAVPILCGVMGIVFCWSEGVRRFDGIKFRQEALLNGNPATIIHGADRAQLQKTCGLAKDNIPLFQSCLRDGREEPRYALLGDSKAEALIYGLVRESSPAHRWVFIGSVYAPEAPASVSKQALKNQLAYDTIATNPHIELVVLSIALRSLFPIHRDTGFIAADLAPETRQHKLQIYTAAIQRFERAGKRVVWIIDNPTFPDPRSCIQGGLTGSTTLNHVLRRKENPRCQLRYSDHIAHTQPYRTFVQQLQQMNPALRVYDPTPLLCDIEKNHCTVTQNGNFLYSYTDHISDYANSKIARDLLPTL